mgnify:CR=1 FL=1
MTCRSEAWNYPGAFLETEDPRCRAPKAPSTAQPREGGGARNCSRQLLEVTSNTVPPPWGFSFPTPEVLQRIRNTVKLIESLNLYQWGTTS